MPAPAHSKPDPSERSAAAEEALQQMLLDSMEAKLDRIEAQLAELKQLFPAEGEDGS